MIIKTSELEGAALDYAVGISGAQNVKITEKGWVCAVGPRWWGPYEPSKRWGQGGPLIDNYNIELICDEPDLWTAIYDGPSGTHDFVGMGETPLIAACRAIVAAKIGPEIDVPEELV